VSRRGAWRDLRESLEGLADRQRAREARRLEKARSKRIGRRPGIAQAAKLEERMPWPKNELRPEDALRSRASFLP
jgi:hypothetical protein